MMLDTLGDIVRSIVIMVILAGLLEMLLPANNMRRYVRLVVGLFLIYILITPLVKIAEGEGMTILTGLPQENQAVSVIAEEGKKIADENRKRVVQEYTKAIARQVKALLALEKEIYVEEVQVNVEPDEGKNNYGQIREITIVAGKESGKNQSKANEEKDIKMVAVNPVKVHSENEQHTPVNTSWSHKMAAMIADFYGLSVEQVKIVKPKEG